jgi:hypothetical protein
MNISVTPFDFLHPATPKKLINFIKNLGELLEKMPLIKEFSGSLLIYGRKSE